MVQAVELLILSLFSSSQVEELLILIHIEFNISAAEFVIAAGFVAVYSTAIVILVRTNIYLF